MCFPLAFASSAAAVGGSVTTVAGPLGFAAGIGTAAAPAFSAASLFTLPNLAVTAGVVGFGVQAYGQAQAGGAQGGQFAYREAVLRNNAIIKQQDIKMERENLQLRRKLIGEQGKRDIGDTRVAQAALGQLVDEGSAADITHEVAGETAFRKLLEDRETQLRVRNIKIAAANDQSDADLVALQRQASDRATRISIAEGALSTTSTLARRFRFDSGSLAFRT